MEEAKYRPGRPLNNDPRRPIQFTAYYDEEKTKIHSRRFQFTERRVILEELKKLYYSSPDIVRVDAYDTDLEKVVKTRPATRGGWRRGAGRKTVDRHWTTTFTLSEAARDILRQQKNHSAYVDAAVKEKYKREQQEKGEV